MDRSDWPITKIDVTFERIEIRSSFWARWKAVMFLFPTVCDTHTPKNSFYEFRKLGHVTDDVIIIGSRDQNWSNFFSPTFSQIYFRKSRGGIRPHYKGLGRVKYLSVIEEKNNHKGSFTLLWLIFAGINFRGFYRDIDGYDLKIRPKTLILCSFMNYFASFFGKIFAGINFRGTNFRGFFLPWKSIPAKN